VEMAKVCKSLGYTLLLAVLLLGVPKIAGKIASIFPYGTVDPDGVFAWIAVHHLAQGAMFLAIMAIANKIRSLDFKLARAARIDVLG
jgi:hypothetical protein